MKISNGFLLPIVTLAFLSSTSVVTAVELPESLQDLKESVEMKFTGQTAVPMNGATDEEVKSDPRAHTATVFAGESDEIAEQKKAGELDAHRDYGKGADGERDPSKWVKTRDEAQHKASNAGQRVEHAAKDLGRKIGIK